jgi:hypothetical protein
MKVSVSILGYNDVMKCPICNEEMKELPSDVSYNLREPGKEYDRTVYQCEVDDAWVNVEIPRTTKDSIQSQ